MIISPRLHIFEINDQPWWPSYLRAKVQECLTLAWTHRVPLLQPSSPAVLVASVLLRILGPRVQDLVFVDFASGAGGPTPAIEGEVNRRMATASEDAEREKKGGGEAAGVAFVMTDLRPHVPAWRAACRGSVSGQLGYVGEGVDAAAAPGDLLERVQGVEDVRAPKGVGKGVKKAKGKGVFRLFSLAFHHFDDELAEEILRDSLETSEGFGIFELQSRTISSLITIFLFGPLITFTTPFFFYDQPLHLLFTYIIPLIPFCLCFDGYISSLRTRTPAEVEALLIKANGGKKLEGWRLLSGEEAHTWPTGWLGWVICVKE